VSATVCPGDDVEAWCTRCRMNLNHRVIALVGKEIQRVHCLTCGGDHKYHPPKHAQTAERVQPERTRVSNADATEKTRKPKDKAPSRPASEWNTVMKEMPPETSPRPYRTSESYGASEFIEHPVFGTGRVLEIVGSQRIQVIFREGRKILVCNVKPSG